MKHYDFSVQELMDLQSALEMGCMHLTELIADEEAYPDSHDAGVIEDARAETRRFMELRAKLTTFLP